MCQRSFKLTKAALDKLDDNTLWQIVHSRKTAAALERYNILLEGNQSGTLTEAERLELMALRNDAERFMLRKAQAAVLLRWRGHSAPRFVFIPALKVEIRPLRVTISLTLYPTILQAADLLEERQHL